MCAAQSILPSRTQITAGHSPTNMRTTQLWTQGTAWMDEIYYNKPHLNHYHFPWPHEDCHLGQGRVWSLIRRAHVRVRRNAGTQRVLTFSLHKPPLNPSKLPQVFIRELSDLLPTFMMQCFNKQEIWFSLPVFSADHLLELASWGGVVR